MYCSRKGQKLKRHIITQTKGRQLSDGLGYVPATFYLQYLQTNDKKSLVDVLSYGKILTASST